MTVHASGRASDPWAVEHEEVPMSGSELALAHADDNKTRKSYRRTDFFEQRRDLMERWAQFLESRASQPPLVDAAPTADGKGEVRHTTSVASAYIICERLTLQMTSGMRVAVG